MDEARLDVRWVAGQVSPWTACWGWAGVILAVSAAERPRPGQRLSKPGAGLERALLAFAVSVLARDAGITAEGEPVAPRALGEISLVDLSGVFDGPLLLHVGRPQKGHRPAPGEPGAEHHDVVAGLTGSSGGVEAGYTHVRAAAGRAQRAVQRAGLRAVRTDTSHPLSQEVAMRGLGPYVSALSGSVRAEQV